ncbi:MAG TPA: hypothetical protein VGR08_00715, partial [Thermomicrobiales bacterium]|nr:hypothetical protein [Thermomicrobiales bacterium]
SDPGIGIAPFVSPNGSRSTSDDTADAARTHKDRALHLVQTRTIPKATTRPKADFLLAGDPETFPQSGQALS